MPVQILSPVVPQPKPEVVPEPLSDEEAEQQFVKALNGLLDEAIAQHRAHIFADCLAWSLARIVNGCGSMFVAGEIVGWFGQHLKRLAERADAQREVEEAKQAGIKLS